MIFLVLAGHNERLEREHNERAWAVYHTALLMRLKQLPPLHRLLHRGARKPQTADQMLQALKTITAMHGGTVIRKEN